MKLDVIKGKKGNYKIISTSNHKHPVLKIIATALEYYNKFSKPKVGVYIVYGGKFSTTISVTSLISGKVERMTKDRYYRWLKGEVQMKPKPKKEKWEPLNIPLELDDIDGSPVNENVLSFLDE